MSGIETRHISSTRWPPVANSFVLDWGALDLNVERRKIEQKKEKLRFSLTCRCVLKKFSFCCAQNCFSSEDTKVQRLHSWLSQSVTAL